MMNFANFHNQARLYILGALDVSEIKEFEKARKHFGQRAEDAIRECRALSEAFALSLRPDSSSIALKARLMSMVRKRRTARLMFQGLACE